jgi:ribokinase
MQGDLFVRGNACLDVTYYLPTLPRRGETVIAQTVQQDLGGKGLIQAITARRMGVDVHFIAAVGRDKTADRIRRVICGEAIATDGLIVRTGVSDSSVILLDFSGENIIVSDTAQSEALSPAELEPLLRLGSSDTLLVQGNLSEATTVWAVAQANAAGAVVILNAAPYRPWLPRLCGRVGAIIANAGEAMDWTAEPTPRAAIASLQAALAVVTVGGQGCLVRTASGDFFEIPTLPADVRDTTGAGDTFTGAFVAEWLMSGDAVGAAHLAVRLASDMTTRFGAVSAVPARATIARLRERLRAVE